MIPGLRWFTPAIDDWTDTPDYTESILHTGVNGTVVIKSDGTSYEVEWSR